MKRRRSNTLVAISSAAVMTVYTAGFMKTRAAAERLEHASRGRVPVIPAAAPAVAPPSIAAAPLVSAPPPAIASASAPAMPAAPPKTTKLAKADVAELAAPATAPLPAPAQPAATPATPPATAEVAAPPVAAPAPVTPAAELAPSAEVLLGGTELHNGTFLGWGRSRHGDIQASVTVYSGRITAVSIAQCRTRYSCDVIAHLPDKVLKDQTPEKINNVSGATQSVDAFYYAVIDALNKAK